MYVKNVKRWMLPFLSRLDRKEPGSYNTLLWQYMTGMAKTDLTLCRLIFEASKSHVSFCMFLLVRVCSEFSQQRRNAEAQSIYNTAQLLSTIGLIAEGAITSFVMLKKLAYC